MLYTNRIDLEFYEKYEKALNIVTNQTEYMSVENEIVGHQPAHVSNTPHASRNKEHHPTPASRLSESIIRRCSSVFVLCHAMPLSAAAVNSHEMSDANCTHTRVWC